MTITPADPGTIDLKAIQSWSTQIAPIPELIAAVEAWQDRALAAEACVTKLEVELAHCKTAQALAKLNTLDKELWL